MVLGSLWCTSGWRSLRKTNLPDPHLELRHSDASFLEQRIPVRPVVLAAEVVGRTKLAQPFKADDLSIAKLLCKLRTDFPALAQNAKVSGAGTASAGLPGWQANGETE